MFQDGAGTQKFSHVSYNQSYIKVIPKDSNTIYLYWEITTDTIFSFQNIFGKTIWDNSRSVIRVRNISSSKIFFIDILPDSTSCYYNIHQPGDMLCAEVGKLVGEEFFISFASSNTIEMPNNKISDEKTVQFADIKASKRLASSENINDIYKHFGFNDIFKVLGPSSSEYTKYIEEHDFNK